MIAIIDYGVGNLRSVEKAFQHIGSDAVVTSDIKTIKDAYGVVLPGVGAFKAAMEHLVRTGLYKAVEYAVSANKPFLGICLGLQLLFDYSEECNGAESTCGTENTNGAESTCGTIAGKDGYGCAVSGQKVNGLGIFKGCIRQIPAGKGLKIPHMGWNSLDMEPGSILFKDIGADPYVYFVHSYCLHAEDRDIVSSKSFYGIGFDASISIGNVHATQFHPEKSGAVGLKILKNFIGLVNEK